MEIVFFIFVTVTISLLGGLLYLIYLPFKLWLLKSDRMTRAYSRWINKIYVWSFVFAIITITYIGIFPDESFYADEFKKVTLRELPESAEFISKSASYPDFHGEYCSESEIKLSKKDFNKLLNELQRDNRLIMPQQRSIISGNNNTEDMPYQFTRKNGHYLYIGFSSDGQTIYVDVCVS